MSWPCWSTSVPDARSQGDSSSRSSLVGTSFGWRSTGPGCRMSAAGPALHRFDEAPRAQQSTVRIATKNRLTSHHWTPSSTSLRMDAYSHSLWAGEGKIVSLAVSFTTVRHGSARTVPSLIGPVSITLDLCRSSTPDLESA